MWLQWGGFSPVLLGAQACEAIGEDQLALAWATGGLETPHELGGDPKPSTLVECRLVRARVIARRGLPGDENKAAADFESAAATAEKFGMTFLQAVALSQHKSFVPRLTTAAHGARLDATVARLHSAPEVIHELLAGSGTRARGLVR